MVCVCLRAREYDIANMLDDISINVSFTLLDS